jgi:hypothetical protein
MVWHWLAQLSLAEQSLTRMRHASLTNDATPPMGTECPIHCFNLFYTRIHELYPLESSCYSWDKLLVNINGPTYTSTCWTVAPGVLPVQCTKIQAKNSTDCMIQLLSYSQPPNPANPIPACACVHPASPLLSRAARRCIPKQSQAQSSLFRHTNRKHAGFMPAQNSSCDECGLASNQLHRLALGA